MAPVEHPASKERVSRVVQVADERNEIIAGPDGFFVYWPEGSGHGALTSANLRTLAAELDRRNEEALK